MEGERPGAAVVAGASVMEDDWARAPAARARRAVVYFILFVVESRDAVGNGYRDDWGFLKLLSVWVIRASECK